jgi:hypothetical protein
MAAGDLFNVFRDAPGIVTGFSALANFFLRENEGKKGVRRSFLMDTPGSIDRAHPYFFCSGAPFSAI